jgi:DNA-binding NarL/FixJ family response regulator
MRAVIAEDSGLLRHLLVESLTSRGVTVTGTADNQHDLLRVVTADPPDIVVADIRMPPTHQDEGLRAAEEIRTRHPATGLLILSQYAETSYAMRLLQVGSHAVGYLVKDRVRDPDRLVDAMARVASGDVVIDPEVVQQVLLRPRVVDPLSRLTPVEKQVLGLVAEGYSNAAIAQKLSYSVKTIEKRVSAVSHKLGIPADEDRTIMNQRVLVVLAYLRSAGQP